MIASTPSETFDSLFKGITDHAETCEVKTSLFYHCCLHKEFGKDVGTIIQETL